MDFESFIAYKSHAMNENKANAFQYIDRYGIHSVSMTITMRLPLNSKTKSLQIHWWKLTNAKGCYEGTHSALLHLSSFFSVICNKLRLCTCIYILEIVFSHSVAWRNAGKEGTVHLVHTHKHLCSLLHYNFYVQSNHTKITKIGNIYGRVFTQRN